MTKNQKILLTIIYLVVTIACAMPILYPMLFSHSSEAAWSGLLLIFTAPIWLIMNIFVVALATKSNKQMSEGEAIRHKIDSRVSLAFVSFPVAGIIWAIASSGVCKIGGFTEYEKVLFGQDCFVSSAGVFIILYIILIMGLYFLGRVSESK